VLLDCDGVIADFTGAALTLIRQFTGRTYAPERITTWDIFDSLPEEPQFVKDEVYRLLKSPGGCAGIPAYPEAVEGVRRLCEIADVIAVTSPFKGSPTWAHEREEWLHVRCPGIEHVIHARHKERVHGDVFVDDKAAHVEDWARFWGREGRNPHAVPVLWQTPRASGQMTSAGIVSASTWDEVIALVREIENGER
jgi:5'(3')-deoxyribonucleotidase